MVVVRVDPKNTPRQRRACKHTDARNRESQAVFECVGCGHRPHADTHAAQNILDRATTTKLTTNPGTPVDRTQKYRQWDTSPNSHTAAVAAV